MTTPQELNEQRLGIIAQQTALNDKVIEEKRDFTSEEDAKYKAMDVEQKALRAKADRILQIEAAQKELALPASASAKPSVDGPKTPEQMRATAEYKTAFRSMLMNGGEPAPEFRAEGDHDSGRIPRPDRV